LTTRPFDVLRTYLEARATFTEDELACAPEIVASE
jgi:hypothetical protein